MFQNFCVELLARAMSHLKRAHPAIEFAQNFAKICMNDARNCCKFFMILTRNAPNFVVFSAEISI